MDAETLTSADAYNKFMNIETIKSDYICLGVMDTESLIGEDVRQGFMDI